LVKRREEFLWWHDMTTPPVRRRDNDPPPDIHLISTEEIAETVKYVLRTQFATPRDDLVRQTARTLGINSTRKNVSSRVTLVISSMLAEGELHPMEGDMMDLKSRHE
jgi:hypothetical protein